MGRLAIVIPSVGSVEALEGTLLSVLENRPAGSEVIVVHARPYDDPYQLEGEVRLIKAPARSSLVDCANLGFRESTADVVHLLAAGCRVENGWTDGVMKHFSDPRVAVVAPMLLDDREPTHALAASVSYGIGGTRKSVMRLVADVRDAGVSPILAASVVAVFYNRVTLSTVGYLSTEVGADLADIDLGLLLRHAGFTSIIDPGLRVRAPDGPLEQLSAFRSAMHAERLFWRNAPLLGWLKSLAAHPWAVAGDIASHTPSLLPNLAGRMIGAAMIGTARRHYQRLMDLRNMAPLPATVATRLVRMDRPHDGSATRKTSQPVRAA